MKATALVLALVTCPAAAAAEDSLRAPCDSSPRPAYAPVGADPTLGVSSGKVSDLTIVAPCADGLRGGFRMIVALAGSFRDPGDASQLLARIGSPSSMKALRYWSVTDQKWTDLLKESSAVEDEKASRHRADFTAEEMRSGKELFYAQRDNRGAQGVYRMRTTMSAPDRIIVQVENATAIRLLLFPIFNRGDLHTVFFLTRRSTDTWDFYLAMAARALPPGDAEPSLINRAAALYRYVAGQQTDKEPPLAPR
jgi:hypothetical protein